MITLKGKYNFANVMLKDESQLDKATKEQIEVFLNHPAFQKTYIGIMPDCHKGAGACIGYTAKMNDYIIPNLVGVDIGCGVSAYNLGQIEVDFEKFDIFIRDNIPYGFNVRDNKHYEKLEQYYMAKDIDLLSKVNSLCLKLKLSSVRVFNSVGTLGGGNHFIELNQASNDDVWLVVHSGSRNFGLQVANYHQKRAKKLCDKMLLKLPKGLEYMPMDFGGKEYLEDMKIAQEYASLNRYIMLNIMMYEYFKQPLYDISPNNIKSVHNYIDLENNIVRKGAISAQKGERLLIPLNMRDGIIVGTGKGNSKWNYSAPHGAGRLLSRTKAKKELNLNDFKEEMKGIWSSCICKSTLDEAPMAYKNMNQIIETIDETANIDFIMKPIFNFKAT